MIRDEIGLSLDKVGREVLGTAAKVELTKDSTTIVGDGSTQDAVASRITMIRNQMEAAEQDYEKEKLNERIAKLSGGVAIIQVGAQTETELKEKKLRVEDALNATKVTTGKDGELGDGGMGGWGSGEAGGEVYVTRSSVRRGGRLATCRLGEAEWGLEGSG